MVDPDRLRRLLGALERYRDLLAEDREDPYRRRYLVQAAAQVCIDVANHVIASEGFRVPGQDAESFTVLAEEGLLDAALAARLSSLAGMRNLLVHMYDEVDDDRIRRGVEAGLGDLRGFAQAIAALAEEEPGA